MVGDFLVVRLYATDEMKFTRFYILKSLLSFTLGFAFFHFLGNFLEIKERLS